MDIQLTISVAAAMETSAILVYPQMPPERVGVLDLNTVKSTSYGIFGRLDVVANRPLNILLCHLIRHIARPAAQLILDTCRRG